MVSTVLILIQQEIAFLLIFFNIKKTSCAQPLEWPFELGFTEQIHKILEDNSQHFQPFWETLFESERAKFKKARKIFRTKKFQDYFWETNTSLFLGGSPFRLG